MRHGGWRRRATGRSAGRASGGPGHSGAQVPVLRELCMPALYNAPRFYVQRFPPPAIPERCARAARRVSRQHHRQVERRRPGARHRSARGRAAGLGSSGRRHDHRRRAGQAPPLAAGAVRDARAARVGRRGRQGADLGADVNLMLEHVWLQYLSTAPINVAVPNPEWFDRHDRRFLAEVDSVWAKTSLHARAVPRARLQHHVHRLRQRRSLREPASRSSARISTSPARAR